MVCSYSPPPFLIFGRIIFLELPYATPAAAELADIWGREFALIRSGDKTVDEVIAAITEDSQIALDKVA